MATDITEGLDPFDLVIRINFDSGGRRAQAEMDEDQAEQAAAAFLTPGRSVSFTDTISGERAVCPVDEAAPEVANWLRIAASNLRSQKAGEVDLRLGLGKVPNA